MASISLWLREVVSLSLPCPSFKSQPTTDVALEKVSATRRENPLRPSGQKARRYSVKRPRKRRSEGGVLKKPPQYHDYFELVGVMPLDLFDGARNLARRTDAPDR
jgi:hypothetical protein